MIRILVRALLFAVALPALAAQDVLIEAELDPAKVHVSAQAIYRLRVYQAVDVQDLRIIGPSTHLADFRAIGDGRVFETQRSGRRYRVHERSYALFPFASGTLELSGAHATGRIVSPDAKSADGRQAIRLNAPPRSLTVLPVNGAADNAPWLPAYDLKLTESWSAADGVHRRTIRIEALGVDAAQLPALQVTADGMSVRAEAPHLENRFAGERNVAVREQTFVMMPLRAGKIAIPMLQLPWWQVERNSPVQATLLARTLNDSPADMQTVEPSPTPLSSASIVALTIPAMLLPVLGLLAWRRRHAVIAAWQLRRACRESNVHAVRDGLLQWAARTWPHAPPRTLAALGERLRNPGTRRALATLERALYGPAPAACSADILRATVLAVKRDHYG